MRFLVFGVFALVIISLLAWRVYKRRVVSGPIEHQVSAKKAADVEGIAISLKISEKLSLFVLLVEEGLINRMGTGSLDNTADDLFVGPGDPAIFQAVRSRLTEGMLQIVGGVFQCPDVRGASCRLEVNFQFKDHTSVGFAFLYGSDSQGPPKDVVDFVKAAVFHTDPWYENFKRNAAGLQKT